MERGYVAFIGSMVRHSGIMVILALCLSGVGVLRPGAAADGVHPDRRPGLPASPPCNCPMARRSGAPPAALRAGRQDRHGRCPGVAGRDRAVRACRCSTTAPTSPTPAPPGSCSKPFADRLKAKGQDLLRIYRKPAEGARQSAGRPGLRAAAAADPGHRQRGRLPDAARNARRQLRLSRSSNELTQQIVKAGERRSRVCRTSLTTFRTERAACRRSRSTATRAETLRVSVGDVFATLTDYVGSTYVNQFNKFGLSLQVYVQADSQFRLHPDDLLNLYVRSSDKQMVPIGAVAHLGPTVAPPLITLYNLFPSATIVGAPARGLQLRPVDDRDGADRQASAAGRRQLRMDGDVVPGEASPAISSTTCSALSVLLVYLCLAGQYESWILPLAVLAAVPLALLGPGDRADQPRRRQQSLHADRPDAADRAVGEERHPDRRGGAREAPRRRASRSSRPPWRRRAPGSGRS